ncbi:MAG: hypothetical protein IT372_29415 [Polyangiaceae bacterium]|nr:hypothetical protein [Polyangiaceae bacterium]
MPSIRPFVRPLAVALSLAFAAVPATALADSSRPAPADVKEGKEHGKGHGKDHEKKDRPQFPLEAAKFQQIVDKRIGHARKRMERAMEKRNAPDALRAQIRKEFDAGAAQVQAAAKRVGADGTVTKEEAKEVRDLVKSLKRKAREKYGRAHKKGKADA